MWLRTEKLGLSVLALRLKRQNVITTTSENDWIILTQFTARSIKEQREAATSVKSASN